MLSPSLCAAAGPPPEFAKIQINDRLAAMGEPRMQSMRIAQVSFSPDGSRLAIEFRDVENQYVLKVHPAPPRLYVMVVPTGNSSEPGFLINPQKLSFPGSAPMTHLWWSPDGASLV